MILLIVDLKVLYFFLKHVIIVLEHPVGIDEDDMNVYYPGLVKRIASGDLQLIDVRNPDEIEQSGKIGNSYNIPGEVLGEMFIKPRNALKISDPQNLQNSFDICKGLSKQSCNQDVQKFSSKNITNLALRIRITNIPDELRT